MDGADPADSADLPMCLGSADRQNRPIGRAMRPGEGRVPYVGSSEGAQVGRIGKIGSSAGL